MPYVRRMVGERDLQCPLVDMHRALPGIGTRASPIRDRRVSVHSSELLVGTQSAPSRTLIRLPRRGALSRRAAG